MDENRDDTLEGGARDVVLSSWQEFHQEARTLKSKRGYVWRGQKTDWPLLSSFDRRARTKDRRDRDKKLKHHLDNFREAMNELYPDVLRQDGDDIWALGQHYGLRTPLLDWTASPYIAAYFAFDEGLDRDDRSDCYRYVYALNRSVERLLSGRKERCVAFVDRLRYPNPRFTRQAGIFTKALQGVDIWEYVQTYRGKRPREEVIVKFRIPTKDRESCLHDLHLMSIDRTSLLLDLHDVVDYCNSKL